MAKKTDDKAPQEGAVSDEAKKKADAVFEKIIRGGELKQEVKTRRGTFTIKYPTPRDIRKMRLLATKRLEGLTEEQVGRDTYLGAIIYAALDTIIVDGPEWWENLETFEDCPDEDLAQEVFGRYLRFRDQILGWFSGRDGVPGGPPGEAGPDDSASAMGDGSLSGLAYGPKVQRPDAAADGVADDQSPNKAERR